MADWTWTLEQYADLYQEWKDTYQIAGFLEFSAQNWEAVQALDPHLVWTSHSTCEDDKVTNGAHDYTGSCCWQMSGWFIGNVPWEGDETTHIAYLTNAKLPCPVCNLHGSNPGPYPPTCEDCHGDGFVFGNFG